MYVCMYVCMYIHTLWHEQMLLTFECLLVLIIIINIHQLIFLPPKLKQLRNIFYLVFNHKTVTVTI